MTYLPRSFRRTVRFIQLNKSKFPGAVVIHLPTNLTVFIHFYVFSVNRVEVIVTSAYFCEIFWLKS
jgi:hypothetical protein